MRQAILMTSQGTYVDVLAPFDKTEGEDFPLLPMLLSLARTPRFSGLTRGDCWVSDHSVRVAALLWKRSGSKRLGLLGGLHDIEEAYLGDVPTPLGRHLEIAGTPWEAVKDNLRRRIFRALRVGYPTVQEWPWIHTADLTVLRYEALMHVSLAAEEWHCFQTNPPLSSETFEDLNLPSDCGGVHRVAWLTDSASSNGRAQCLLEVLRGCGLPCL